MPCTASPRVRVPSGTKPLTISKNGVARRAPPSMRFGAYNSSERPSRICVSERCFFVARYAVEGNGNFHRTEVARLPEPLGADVRRFSAQAFDLKFGSEPQPSSWKLPNVIMPAKRLLVVARQHERKAVAVNPRAARHEPSGLEDGRAQAIILAHRRNFNRMAFLPFKIPKKSIDC